MGAKTGHLGPTVFRSTDRGRTGRKPQAARVPQGGGGRDATAVEPCSG